MVAWETDDVQLSDQKNWQMKLEVKCCFTLSLRWHFLQNNKTKIFGTKNLKYASPCLPNLKLNVNIAFRDTIFKMSWRESCVILQKVFQPEQSHFPPYTQYG